VPIPEHIRRKSARPVRYPEGASAPDFVAPELAHAYDYTVNVASHDINLLRFLFGDELAPVAMHVRAGGTQRAIVDAGTFTIALTLGPADLGVWDQALSVTFEKGRATLVLPSPLARQDSAATVLTHQGRTEEIRVPANDHVWSFEAQARSFVNSALTGAPLESSGADALADLRLIEGLWKTVDWHQ
jgi:predicted dehydrogenase